ncbi:hypothetical protein E2562_011882 [Oryza meyeriana var. granulata]|uniref:Uncharacterized protein n=1 Tax=Oryza meyeriana var. granulata TaxID=110450 RepID=A0A6G1CE94_9ORYZ|nr:hypothetical protein E2562_011882 [Oryza meyeriana var. granulata]
MFATGVRRPSPSHLRGCAIVASTVGMLAPKLPSPLSLTFRQRKKTMNSARPALFPPVPAQPDHIEDPVGADMDLEGYAEASEDHVLQG